MAVQYFMVLFSLAVGFNIRSLFHRATMFPVPARNSPRDCFLSFGGSFRTWPNSMRDTGTNHAAYKGAQRSPNICHTFRGFQICCEVHISPPDMWR